MDELPKILVVDDLPANRLAIRTALREVEATLVEAGNGFDALAIALEEDFALILLDVQMPEMDGFEVCERLGASAQTAETPVIFITAANKADEDRIHGYLTGAIDYLLKPINEQILRAKTRIFLRLHQQNRALQVALAAAQAADRAKDTFLANVSHELRTPLNAVIGLSALARKCSSDPQQRDYLDKVNDAGQTLLAIINDLLDLARIAAGGMPFEAKVFSLRQTVARVSSVLGHRASEKGLRLATQIDTKVPERLFGDPLRIEQILLNLQANAIKFTDSGGIDVRIALAEQEEQRLCLQIEVEDSGIGMSEDEIARIYQPFVQSDATITRKHGGSGLGLAICKQLAEAMGGSITVSSHPGSGTLFRVRVWLGLASDSPPAEPAGTSQQLPGRYCNAAVLVVDDQALNREIVVQLLASVGISPRLAENGQEALDALCAAGPEAFDLVLMDIQMPVMDGITAVRRIRALPGFSRLPIVAMTAHAMVHEKLRYLDEGMNDHLGKPFSLPDFFALLARWLARRVDPPPAGALLAMPAGCGESELPMHLSRIAGLDTDSALQRFAGSEARYCHWLRVFIAESAGFTAALDTLVANAEIAPARLAVHAFRGRVGMLGMTELHALAAAIEEALSAGDACLPLRKQLAQAIESMVEELSKVVDATPETMRPATQGRPDGPLPPPIAALNDLLAACDGRSAEAIAACLDELQLGAWWPLLRAALQQVQCFDFDAARRLFDDQQATALTESTL